LAMVRERAELTAQQRMLESQAARATGISQLYAQAEVERLIFEQREFDILAHPPETKLERLEQEEALRQLNHERELARMQEDADAREMLDRKSEALAKAERKRVSDTFKQKKATMQAVQSLTQSAQQFASLVMTASIKDDEKRARAEQVAGGVAAGVKGAVEAVNAAAAYASLNIPQGIAHTAASVFSFATMAALFSGKIPTGGGPKSAPTDAAPSSRGRDRNTSDAQKIPDSVPAADRQPGQRLGPKANEQQQGGNVYNIDLSGSVGLDQGAAEKIAVALKNVDYSLGAA